MSKYITIGTIKTIDLSNHTFTIEPISAYRFQTKVDDENSWKIVFKEEDKEEPNELKLADKSVKFVFDNELTSGLIVLKQNKTKITVRVASVKISRSDSAATGTNGPMIKGAINDSVSVEIEIK